MKTAIVLGTFDGLHDGHRAVIEKARGFYSVAVTFAIPPKGVISGKPELLILPEDRENRIKQLGIDRVEMQDFNKIRKISAGDYLENLKNKYNPSRIICGFNYRFGYNAEGSVEFLADFCKNNDIEFICVHPVEKDGVTVSATNVRNLIREGKMKSAASQIYGGFAFFAPVLHGDMRGRQIGFPTANQEYPEMLVKPKFGVYLSRVNVDGVWYSAITNVGIRPTYQTQKIGCETYIKDFSGDIYGKTVKTELLLFLREEKKFSSLEELKNAIINDVKSLD